MTTKNVRLKDMSGNQLIPDVGIPAQAEQSGKFLSTNGSALIWATPSGGGSGGSSTWGEITGTLSNQTDLQTALDAKQDTLVSGTNIKTVGGTSLLGSGNVTISSIENANTNTGVTNPLVFWEGTQTQWNQGGQTQVTYYAWVSQDVWDMNYQTLYTTTEITSSTPISSIIFYRLVGNEYIPFHERDIFEVQNNYVRLFLFPMGGEFTYYRDSTADNIVNVPVSVGELHPSWICNIEGVGVKKGTTNIVITPQTDNSTITFDDNILKAVGVTNPKSGSSLKIWEGSEYEWTHGEYVNYFYYSAQDASQDPSLSSIYSTTYITDDTTTWGEAQFFRTYDGGNTFEYVDGHVTNVNNGIIYVTFFGWLEITYTYYPGGDIFKPVPIAELHPDWLCNVEGVGVRIGNTVIANASTNITVDSTPTSGSTNAVMSGGVYTALNNKQNKLTAGDGINITNNTISVGLTAGDGIDITNNTISVDGVSPDTITLATVATSGSYYDLSNQPTIPVIILEGVVQDIIDLAPVAITGSYNNLINKPTIPTTTSSVTSGSTSALTSGGAYTALQNYQTKANLVTSVSSSSTDSQYPSAKLFYDTIGDIETLLANI